MLMVAWRRSKNMIISIAIVAVLIIIAVFLFWVFSNPGYTLNKGVASATLQGKIQLWILRAAVPLMTGVNRSLGLVKYAMEELPPVKILTRRGLVTLTFYRPLGFKEAVLPLYINHHAGGFVVGYAEQDDMICRYLAHHACCMVVNVDYILAPENPYPAQIYQCYEVAVWLKTNAQKLKIDADHIAVGGQSAGASISAALCLMAKEMKEDIFCAQILNYGYFDTAEDPMDKFIEFGRSQVLGPKMLGFFQNLYLPRVKRRGESFASPLLAADLTGLPEALIITAQHDLMKNDGNRYADKLKQSGVKVTHREFEDTDHGFTHNGPKVPAQIALKMMANTLKNKFNHE